MGDRTAEEANGGEGGGLVDEPGEEIQKHGALEALAEALEGAVQRGVARLQETVEGSTDGQAQRDSLDEDESRSQPHGAAYSGKAKSLSVMPSQVACTRAAQYWPAP